MDRPFKFLSNPRFRPMLPWGVVTGLATVLWFVFAPLLWGRDAWFPFHLGLLLDELSLVAVAGPVAARGWGVVYWAAPGVMMVVGFVWPWWSMRREDVLLERETLLQERRAEHADHIRRSEELWRAFEAAEGDGERQLELLGRYGEEAELVELTADVTGDRSRKCRELARRAGQENPALALRLLRLARELRHRGKAAGPSLWPFVMGDLGGYTMGAGGLLLGIPLGMAMVVSLLGLVIWTVKIVLIGLTIAAVVVLLALLVKAFA